MMTPRNIFKQSELFNKLAQNTQTAAETVIEGTPPQVAKETVITGTPPVSREDIKNVQNQLNEMLAPYNASYTELALDGIMGDKTKQALNLFKEKFEGMVPENASYVDLMHQVNKYYANGHKSSPNLDQAQQRQLEHQKQEATPPGMPNVATFKKYLQKKYSL